jgi:hypothetical protein
VIALATPTLTVGDFEPQTLVWKISWRGVATTQQRDSNLLDDDMFWHKMSTDFLLWNKREGQAYQQLSSAACGGGAGGEQREALAAERQPLRNLIIVLYLVQESLIFHIHHLSLQTPNSFHSAWYIPPPPSLIETQTANRTSGENGKGWGRKSHPTLAE